MAHTQKFQSMTGGSIAVDLWRGRTSWWKAGEGVVEQNCSPCSGWEAGLVGMEKINPSRTLLLWSTSSNHAPLPTLPPPQKHAIKYKPLNGLIHWWSQNHYDLFSSQNPHFWTSLCWGPSLPHMTQGTLHIQALHILSQWLSAEAGSESTALLESTVMASWKNHCSDTETGRSKSLLPVTFSGCFDRM